MKMTQLQNLFFHEKTLEHYTDKSVLELLLTTAGFSENVHEMIEGLYSTFGSFRGILDARPEQLMKAPYVTKRAASMIALIAPLAKVLERSSMENPNMIGGVSDAEHFCKSLLIGERNEKFYVIALNCKCELLGYKMISEGTLTSVAAYPRRILETALNYNACSVILCHNHPSGSCKPSQEDIESTKNVQKILESVNINVLDHLIVAGNTVYSMVQNDDFTYNLSGSKKSDKKSKGKKHKKKK